MSSASPVFVGIVFNANWFIPGQTHLLVIAAECQRHEARAKQDPFLQSGNGAGITPVPPNEDGGGGSRAHVLGPAIAGECLSSYASR